MWRDVSCAGRYAIEINRVANAALAKVSVDDLTRLRVTRTSSLRSYLEGNSPGDWAFKCEAGRVDFMEDPAADGGATRGPRLDCLDDPSRGLFWYAEEPLSLLLSGKLSRSRAFEEEMTEARREVKVAKREKNREGMDLKKRLKAAKREAAAESAIGALNTQRKREAKERREGEVERAKNARRARELARSTEVLVESLRRDGVDVERYFREVEGEERREAWEKEYQSLEEGAGEDGRGKGEGEGEGEGEEEPREEAAGGDAVETELERRERLRRAAKSARDGADDAAERREARECKRIAWIKSQDKEKEQEERKRLKILERDGNRWALERKQELKTSDHKARKEEDKKEGEREDKFKKYLQKIENKASRKQRDEDKETKDREGAMEKLRMNWFEEAQEQRKRDEEEEGRLRRIEDAKESARAKVAEDARNEKARKLEVRREKFRAHKSLVVLRMASATWMKKEGAVRFYDSVGWREGVEKVKMELVESGVVGMEDVGLANPYGEVEGKEPGTESTAGYTIVKQGDGEINGQGEKGDAEWIDEISADGKKYQVSAATGEMRFK